MVVIPKFQYKASSFTYGKTGSCYTKLRSGLDWNEDDGMCCMLALDKDKRHSTSDMVHYRHCRNGTGRGELRDRRELDKHTEGWIQLTAKQIVAAGPWQCAQCSSRLSVLCLRLRGALARICCSWDEEVECK